MQLRFTHPLAAAPGVGQQFAIAATPQNGSGSTINRAGAVSMRFIADTADWDNTRMGIVLGESGNPASPHWKDQLEDWQSVNPRSFAFGKKAVVSAAKETILLVPPETK